jgi:hypothetical protein
LRGMQALGFSGMSAGRLGQYRPKFTQINTYPENGRSHYLGPHLANPRFLSAYCRISFGGITVGVPVVSDKIDLGSEVAPVEPKRPAEKSGQEARSGKSHRSTNLHRAVKQSANLKQTNPSGNRTSHLRRRNGVLSSRG